jgi:hypothetical protein
MVIGNDLRNEVRLDVENFNWPAWGTNITKNDWKKAAMEAGNRIHKINPNQLIFIESPFSATNMYPIRKSPVKLDIPNKVVYSWHYYSF